MEHLFRYMCSIGGEINSEWNKTNDVILLIRFPSIFGVGRKFFIIARLLYANLRIHFR
jgi:hypothetical protein